MPVTSHRERRCQRPDNVAAGRTAQLLVRTRFSSLTLPDTEGDLASTTHRSVLSLEGIEEPPEMSGVFTIKPKGSYTQRNNKKPPQPTQSCLCKPNSDGRCCTSKSCGCSRAGLGCSTACTCRGFKLVCANATPPVAAPVSKPSSDSDAAGKKRPAQGEAGPWQGQARKLADDPFALAQAKSARDATREAFLARLEAEQHAAAAGSGGGGDGAAAVPGRDSEDDLSDDVPIAASKRQDDAAGPSLGRNNYGGGSAAAAAAPAAAARKDVVDLVDLCDSDDDDVRVVSVSGGGRAGVPSATTSVGGAAAGRGAGAVSTSASAPSARGATASAAAAAGPSKPNPAAANPRSPARYDPFQPRQYVPAGGFSALLRGGELRVNESAELQNVDGGWDRGLTACLDTGNEGCTLLNIGAAARAGLVDPVTGEPVGSFGRCETVEVRGVVAGASERVPLMSARYRISGKEMRVTVGITRARLGCDLLIGRKDLLEFERDGYRLSAKR